MCAILHISLAFHSITAETKLSPCRQTPCTSRNYLLFVATKKKNCSKTNSCRS